MPIRVPRGMRVQVAARPDGGRRSSPGARPRAPRPSSAIRSRPPRAGGPASTRRRRRWRRPPRARGAACPPGRSAASTTVTVASGRARDSSHAAARPAMPPPTTTIRDPAMGTPFQDRDGFVTTGAGTHVAPARSRSGVRTYSRPTRTDTTDQGVAMFRRASTHHRSDRIPARAGFGVGLIAALALGACSAGSGATASSGGRPRPRRRKSRRRSPGCGRQHSPELCRRQRQEHRPDDHRRRRHRGPAGWTGGTRPPRHDRLAGQEHRPGRREGARHLGRRRRASSWPRTSAPPTAARPARRLLQGERDDLRRDHHLGAVRPARRGHRRPGLGRHGHPVHELQRRTSASQIVDTQSRLDDHAGQRRAGARLPRRTPRTSPRSSPSRPSSPVASPTSRRWRRSWPPSRAAWPAPPSRSASPPSPR